MSQKIQVKEDLISKLKLFAKIASIVVIIIAIIVLCGWMLNVPILKSFLPGFISMKTNAAIAFLLGGISLYLWMIENSDYKIKRIAQICAFILFLIGLFTLLEYLLNINLGIDQLFFKESLPSSDTFYPNRMAPISAFLFILLGYALIFLNNRKHIKFIQFATIIVGFIGLLEFISYIYNGGPVYGIGNYTPIAFISTIAFLILGLGVLFTRAEYELMGIVTSIHFGGYVADSLLPPAVVIPLLFGSLILFGWKLGIYGVEFGISLTVIVNIAIFTAIVWWSANSFNKMDIKRKNAENQLKEYHDHLEKIVEKRTEELMHINEQLQTEITERKLMEEKIKLSLEEKELLLTEVHHRVKNNMQIISSLLSLQSNYIENENELEVFKESKNRIKSMALVHEKLYQSRDFKSIDFREYINSLVFNLSSSYEAQYIDLNININSISLDINNAIPCGLIINEIITNSFKHAFPETKGLGPANEKFVSPDGKTSKIDIDFYKDGEKHMLIISDNGIGFPEDLDIKNTRTLGLQLINTLVKQLDGTIELDRAHGTTFKISFEELIYNNRI